jgi:Ca-activated chloride channel homolog
VFTVGIGYGPNEYFVRQVARTSGGLAVLIAPGERLEPPVLRLFNRAMSEPVTGLRLGMARPRRAGPLQHPPCTSARPQHLRAHG